MAMRPPTWRLLLLFLGLMGLLSSTLARFFYLQIVEGSHWRSIADRQHLLRIHEPFFRGTLNLHDPQARLFWPLSYDLPRFHLCSDTKQLPPIIQPLLLQQLTELLSLDAEQGQAVHEQLQVASRSRRLLYGLSIEQKQAIEKWWERFYRLHKLPKNALFLIEDPLRSHPQEELLAHLLHTTQRFKEEKSQQSLPTGGVEAVFDHCLQGKSGMRQLKRTLKKPLASDEIISPAKDGCKITLSLNPRLQASAERILQEALVRYGASRAWAVVVEPVSGRVLALAQAPTFALSEYGQHFLSSGDQLALTHTWAAEYAYEVGSVIKPITLAIALKANDRLKSLGHPPLFDDQEGADLHRAIFPGRRTPLKDVQSSKKLNMDMALQRSSNIYMARLMQQVVDHPLLGGDWYRKQLIELGLGSSTHLEVATESSGHLPIPGKVTPSGALEWSKSTPVSLAIGHNLLVSTLQLARFYAALANGGWLVPLTLVETVCAPVQEGGEIIYHALDDLRTISPRVLDSSTCERVLQAMAYVVKEGGSARRAQLPGYSLGAKTGTANKFVDGQYDPRHTLSTCVGLLPIKNTQAVVVVTLDEPTYFFIPGQGYNHRAGLCAAPTLKLLLKEAAAILSIPTDYPQSYLPPDPRFNPLTSFWHLRNRQLQELYQEWNNPKKQEK